MEGTNTWDRPIGPAAEPPKVGPATAPTQPESVATYPLGKISLIELFPVSATKTSPDESTTKPVGALNAAAEPKPLALPACPACPATVVVTPDGEIRRTVSLPVSATYTFPAESTAMPEGLLKRAAEPVPSAEPDWPGLPARVLTVPKGVTVRTVWFPES